MVIATRDARARVYEGLGMVIATRMCPHTPARAHVAHARYARTLGNLGAGS